MRIEAYIICWNEARILPWVLQYWKAAGIDRLVVYDNGSDDDTLAILEDWPIDIEVRHYDSGGEANDWIYRSIKETCWKDSAADWVFVGDTDEVLFVPGGLKAWLQSVQDDVLQPCLYQMVSWSLPVDPWRWTSPDHMRASLLHEYPEVRLQKLGPNKVNLFRPSAVTAMSYGLGAHRCCPMRDGDTVPVTYREDLAFFHLKNLGVEYLLERNAQLYARLPQKVKDEKRIATHYLPGTDLHNVASGLADMWADAKPYKAFDTLLPNR